MRTQISQTRINFYTNLLALLANVLVGFYYTPYLVNNLGLGAYGILPLALIINQFISIATQTLTHAYTRFYSIAYQKGDYEGASRVLSSSFAVMILICLVLLPIAIWIIVDVDIFFNIPDNLLGSAKLLFAFTIFSFVLSLFSSFFNVVLYAANRLDFMNVLKILRAALKLVGVILFFETIRVEVAFVGLANMLTEFLILLLSLILYFRFKHKELRISPSLFSKAVVLSIMGMSTWLLIQLCGDTLLYRIDNLIVNHYWGIEQSGALGTVSELGTYVSVVVSVIGSLFGPLILIAYSKNNHEEIKSLMVGQSTIVGTLSAIITGIISGVGYTLLNVWLGNGMGQYCMWLLIKMVVLPYFAAGGILAFVYRAWNRMILPALGTLFIGLLDVISLIVVCEILKPDTPLVVLLLSAIFAIVQSFILNWITIGRIYKDVRLKFITVTIKISVTFALSCILGRLLVRCISISNLFQLCAALIGCAIPMLVIVYIFFLNKMEKNQLRQIILK